MSPLAKGYSAIQPGVGKLPLELISLILDQVALEVIFGCYEAYRHWDITRRSLLDMTHRSDGSLARVFAQSMDRTYYRVYPAEKPQIRIRA